MDTALGAQHVHRPRRLLVGRARAAAAQQGHALRAVLGLEEELEERGVGEVLGVRSEHDLHQARDLDLAQEIGVIDQRHSAHLDVVLGRDRDLEPGFDAVVRTYVKGPVGAIGHPVAFGLATDRLVGGRPDQAAAHVP